VLHSVPLSASEAFDLFYYDELGRQDERIRLTIDPSPIVSPEPFDPNKKDMTPPLEHCIRTNWEGASVDWNGTDPLL
jgi:ubiquitin carboxyl-terminal hydrolase MINDY-3/4